jgi:hypothetical protein
MCSHRGDAENALRFVTDGHGVRLLCRDCQKRQHHNTHTVSHEHDERQVD